MLGRHQLEQQQQGLHCHAEGRGVDHLEERMGVLLYKGLYILCSNEWERPPDSCNDGAQDARIDLFCLRSRHCQGLLGFWEID